MKSKSGQVLILSLIIMAVGLIVISPLLSYLNSSYRLFTREQLSALGYLTADAMMEQIFSDMYAGENIYVLNSSGDGRRYNQDSWLNGFDIRTVVNNSIAAPPPPPGEGKTSEAYLDPGCSLGLNTLAYGGTYDFKLYLTDNTSLAVNWYFNDAKLGTCHYYCNGSMWITDSGGATVCGSSSAVLFNGPSTAFNQRLNYIIPKGGAGNYTIHFKNLATRKSGSGCKTINYRAMSDLSADSNPPGRPTFSGIGEDKYTWVHLFTQSESYGVYQDYTISCTASINNEDAATITACVRQTPGPLKRHQAQSIAVVSWIVHGQ